MDAWTFVNKEARFVKKPLKIVLLVLALILAAGSMFLGEVHEPIKGLSLIHI